MLPILPALLLLLVNAPSKMDRVVGLKALGALESLHRKLDSGVRQENPVESSDPQRAWASLLALHLGAADLEHAFATLLGIHARPEAATSPVLSERVLSAPPPRPVVAIGALTDGCLACRRTRDGPVSR